MLLLQNEAPFNLSNPFPKTPTKDEDEQVVPGRCGADTLFVVRPLQSEFFLITRRWWEAVSNPGPNAFFTAQTALICNLQHFKCVCGVQHFMFALFIRSIFGNAFRKKQARTPGFEPKTSWVSVKRTIDCAKVALSYFWCLYGYNFYSNYYDGYYRFYDVKIFNPYAALNRALTLPESYNFHDGLKRSNNEEWIQQI